MLLYDPKSRQNGSLLEMQCINAYVFELLTHHISIFYAMIWQSSIFVLLVLSQIGSCKILCESDLKPPSWASLQDLVAKSRSRVLKYDAEEQRVYNQDVFIDAWGFQLNWTKPEEGWYQERKDAYFYLARTGRLKTLGIKKFTTKGYKIVDIPNALYKVILEQREIDKMYAEDCKNIFHLINCKKIINGQTIYANNSFYIPFINEQVVHNTINSKLRPILQKWAKIELAKDLVVYGIRRYLRGSQLLLHTDAIPTHIISAILQIDQKVDEKWPLNLVDHKGQKKSVSLKPGQMLLYESATVPHGRQFPLNGDFYDNIFVHFAPAKEKMIFLN